MLKLMKEIVRSKVVTEGPTDWPADLGKGLPRIEVDRCLPDCALCQEICPTGALVDKVVDAKTCIFCHACREVCPTGAITEADIPTIEGSSVLSEKIKQICRKSLHIRHVDTGACNGCDFEINALTNPIYDLQQYGLDFVASPRHADLLLVTGVVTRNLEIALQKTYAACPKPTLVAAVGACACGGGVFKHAYAAGGGVDKHLPVDVYVPGCPPTPAQIIKGILTAINRW